MSRLAIGDGGPAAPVELRVRTKREQQLGSALGPIRKKWDAFEGALRKSLEKALDLGRALIAAKEKLPHGEFGKLFCDHKRPVEGALPFRSNWANRLMRMAEHPVLSNPQHAADLPPDIETVYQLATMTAPALEAAIESGKVTPATTRAQAKALRRESDREERRDVEAKSAPRRKPERSEIDTLDDCIDRIEDAIRDALTSHPTLRKAIAARMQLIEQRLQR